MNKPFVLNYDGAQSAVLEPNHEQLPYKFPKKLLYAFIPKEDIDAFLENYPHKKLGKFESVSFNPNVYEVEIAGQKVSLCQAPLGAPAAVQLLDWLISYGVEEVLAVGTAGAIVDLPENEMFVVEKALRDEGTSMHYLPLENFIELDKEFVSRIEKSLRDLELAPDKVITWTTDGFFRETENKVKEARNLGCQLVEMECAAMAACAKFRGVKFGQILFTADSLADFENYDERDWGEESHSAGLEIGLKVLAGM